MPPPIDDAEESGTVAILQRFDKITPKGSTVTMYRIAGQRPEFDVRGAYTHSIFPSQPLNYSWYIDWNPDQPKAPVTSFDQEPNVTYVPCNEELDPADGSTGTRPATRQLMVVVSTDPLVAPDNAYLGAGEDTAVTFFTWTLVFEGQDQCPK